MKELTIIYLIVALAGSIGWVMNIIALVGVTQLDGMAILRAVGIFVAPLGAVLGYI